MDKGIIGPIDLDRFCSDHELASHYGSTKPCNKSDTPHYHPAVCIGIDHSEFQEPLDTLGPGDLCRGMDH